jgi:hypothetical protein
MGNHRLKPNIIGRCSRSCLALALCALSASCHGQVQDAALKAAYIYNFALLTNWPASSSAASTDFNVCITGNPPLADTLQKLVGKKVGTKTWTVYEQSAGSRRPDCDIVVLDDTAMQIPLTALNANALIVRDAKSETGSGAAITLVTEGDHIKFDVDTVAAQRNGLRFSSKLLSLARTVR